MKYEQMDRELRIDIMDGVYPPGSRLPTRSKLMERFSTTNATVQNAFNELHKDGLVESRGRNGTFVTERPSCIYTIGIAFPASLSAKESWDPLWSIFQDQLATIEADSDYRFECYYGIESDIGKGDSEKLLGDINRCRLAALVWFWPEPDLVQHFEQPWIQQIIIDRYERVSGAPLIWVDYFDLIDKALEHAKEQKREKVALLINVNMHPEILEHFMEKAQALGLITYPHWIVGNCLCEHALPWAARQVELLVASGGDKHPNALFVMNEQLVVHALEGLNRCGMHPGRDIELIAHTNFPLSRHASTTAHHIGFDVQEMVRRVVKIAADSKAEVDIPKLQLLPAVTGPTP